MQASGCPPSARAYAAAVGLKNSFILVGGSEGHLPWQVMDIKHTLRSSAARAYPPHQFKNDVHVFSLKFDVVPGHESRLTHNKSDLATGVWSRCSMGGGPPLPLGRAQHSAGSTSACSRTQACNSNIFQPLFQMIPSLCLAA